MGVDYRAALSRSPRYDMNLQALAAVAAFSLIAAPVPRDATAKDKRALQGTWVHASLVADGEDVPVRLLPNRTVVIEGDKLTEKDGEKVVSRCAFKLDPSRKPKAIDATPIGRDGPDQAAACLGIYTVEGQGGPRGGDRGGPGGR
jgi:uncharacterized protein (TIGR03067 family)